MAGSNTGRSASVQTEPQPAPKADKPKAPDAPSFGMCEGVRAELELTEKTVDPFTGKTVTRSDVK